MLTKKLTSFVIIVVTCAWAANFAASVAIPGYEPDPAIHGVFMGIVGGALALQRRDKDSSGDDDS